MIFIGSSVFWAVDKPWHPTASECRTYYQSIDPAGHLPSSFAMIGSVHVAAMLFFGALSCDLLYLQFQLVPDMEIFLGWSTHYAARSYIHGR